MNRSSIAICLIGSLVLFQLGFMAGAMYMGERKDKEFNEILDKVDKELTRAQEGRADGK